MAHLTWGPDPPITLLEVLARDATKRVTGAAIRKLQRMREGHLHSGPDSGLRDVWDEICVQVQGSRSVLWNHYEGVAWSVVRSLLGEVSRVELHAVWVQTRGGEEWLDDGDDSPTGEDRPYVEDEVVEYLLKALLRRAGDWSNARIRSYVEGG